MMALVYLLNVANEAFFDAQNLPGTSTFEHLDTARDEEQSHYVPDPAKIVYWAEFGKLALVDERVSADGARIDLDQFHPAQPWQSRPVFWSIRAKSEGTMTLTFPSNGLVDRVGLFLADGDSHFRAVALRSSGETQLVHSFHQGQWVYFPVTASDIRSGTKTIRVIKLIGEDAPVSSVVMLHD